MGQTARILAFNPKADRDFQPCPKWCAGHEDTPSGRRHVGPRASLTATLAGTGGLADIDLRAEYRDDGHGQVAVMWVLKVAGGPAVELGSGKLHWMLREFEKAGWGAAMPHPEGLMRVHDGIAQPAVPDVEEEVHYVADPRNNRGGRV